MSCAGSKRVENSKGFDCRNMGDVLGKECKKKDSSLPRAVDNVLGEEVEENVNFGSNSESDSEKDLDSEEDLSWLLPINTMDIGSKNCKCEGCLKLFESYNSDKKNAKLLLSSWKEFRKYIRNVYINSPLEALQKNQNISFEDNDRLHEIVQVMRLCDPYQLFQKIEDEVCSMVLKSRIRQLNLLKDENNPALAEEFIAGLIEEYVKLLSSALQLSPAIENLLGPQLQRFGLTWEVLNKQLYRSLVYNHFDVQQNLIRFLEQLRKMLPLKDDIYHELVHQYLALDGEMTLIGSMWKDVEPIIQEYRNIKSKENEKLNKLLNAMKDFFANKLCTSEEELEEMQNKGGCTISDDAMQSCPNCMTKRSCPCDECTVTHMMSCEDILLVESPVETKSSSRSRSPSVQNEIESKETKEVEETGEKQSCECHACTVPPPELMDCSAAFNQPASKNSIHGEGFQLYPHIHGTTSETENVSNIYGGLQTANGSVYSHLYNLQNQSSDDSPKINNSLCDQFVQAIMANKTSAKSLLSRNSGPPTPPPPPPPSEDDTPLAKNTPQSASPKNAIDISTEKLEQLPSAKNLAKESSHNKTTKKNYSDKSKHLGSQIDKEKIDTGNKGIMLKENDIVDKTTSEKRQVKQSNNKANGCVISGLCGKCCLKHGSNCSKMSGCSKSADKHIAAMARLNLSGNSASRVSVRPSGFKDEHNHRTAKSHLCNKSKHQENKKMSSRSKKNLEVDDTTSPEDSFSESSNSPSATFQKDPRHCDCCYCEVFGHGVLSVAPVSRNYQEMRERLRLRLNMKKSAKCKTLQSGQTQQQPNQKAIGTSIKSQSNSLLQSGDAKKEFKEQDLESLIKFIEGKKVECRDAKKAAKRARQKQKKQEEKEKLEEEEEEKKRLETVKRHVTISVVNNSNNNNNNNNNNSISCNNTNNIGNNKRSQNQAKQNIQVSKPANQTQKLSQPQTLNLSGLKSLVEKSDPSAVPKMVTIRRVMAPFSAEPTVTITLKGSTPDKDKVLFMLKNGNETLPMEEEEEEEQKQVSKKSKKKKKKAKKEAEIYEEPAHESVLEVSSNKKKKGKNKNSEITSVEALSNKSQLSKILTDNIDSNKNKSRNSKSSVKISIIATSKTSNSNKVFQNSSATKPLSQNKSQSVSNSKSNSQKNVPVLKVQNQDSVNKTNKKDSKSVHCSFSDQIIKNSVGNSKGNVKGVGVSNSAHKLINGKNNNNNNNNNNSGSNNILNQKVKGEKNQTTLVNIESEKPVKKQKTEYVQSYSRVQTPQSKNKINELNKCLEKNPKNICRFPPKLENNQNLEIFPVQDKKEKITNKTKSNKKNLASEVEVNWKGPFDRQEGGKLVINTPSYRLSEVLSSIAPSPPPKEEISLENLRLPPGITITKIEGPIQKPVRPPPQVSHTLKPSPPIVMATPNLKPNPPGNVIVVDTGRLKEVMKENSQIMVPPNVPAKIKKKKKKNKKLVENESSTLESPISHNRIASKVPKSSTSFNKGTMTVLSALDTRKMAPSLESQQATIIKTSDNMVTIRSPALQQAMNMHAYQASQNFKHGINGYSNMNLFNEDVNKINDKISKLKLGNETNDRLTKQMKNLSIKEGSRANELLVQAMTTASSQNNQTNSKKKKKKKKQKSGEEREVEPVESVFQPKDIDLENGDIDDDERELEAFKRFCLQSVPPERKDKVKVNLNIKDIVLKKKSSVIGCS